MLGACQTSLPDVQRLPRSGDAVAASRERFIQDGGELAVRRVRVPASSMRAKAVKQDVSPALKARPISIQFASNEATVGDLAQTLTMSGLQVAFRWQGEKGTDILKRRLPFSSYKGTVGNFLETMRTGLGVVSWQEGPTIFFSDAERYAIALPQDADLLKAVAETAKGLGATDVITSVEGGKVIYSATPALQDEIIGPFLQRTMRNLATVNLQVAIVSMAVNDKSAQGFDWSKFAINLDSRADALAAANRAGVDPSKTPTGTDGEAGGDGKGGSGTGGNSGTSTESGPKGLLPSSRPNQKGGVLDWTSDALIMGGTSTPKVLGLRTAMTVAGAIDWLSTFGNTNVTQNLELRTLSGKQVKFRSGQEIPYVKDISTTSGNNSNSTTGSANTETVETGLTFEMTPRFDSDAELVTVDMKLELKSVLEFVKLSAGNQIGELTQPRTQEQELNDIVRMRAGQTVVVGGLQYDQEQYNGNEPTVARDWLKGMSSSFGKRAQDIQRNALFIILRPVITVYEPDASESASALVTK